MPLATIILPVLNGWRDTIRSLEYIKKNTTDVGYEVIVVDDGSDYDQKISIAKPIAAYCRNYTVVLRYDNRGFGPSLNQGIKLAHKDSQYIVVTANDIVVPPKWLSICIERLRSCTLVAYNGKMVEVGWVNPTVVEPIGVGPQPIHATFEDYIRTYYTKSQLTDSPLMLGARAGPWVIKRNVIEEVGYLDEQFVPGNYEDQDYIYRMAQNGFAIAATTDCYAYHFGSVTMEREHGNQKALLENKERFIKKWGTECPDMKSIVMERKTKN